MLEPPFGGTPILAPEINSCGAQNVTYIITLGGAMRAHRA